MEGAAAGLVHARDGQRAMLRAQGGHGVHALGVDVEHPEAGGGPGTYAEVRPRPLAEHLGDVDALGVLPGGLAWVLPRRLACLPSGAVAGAVRADALDLDEGPAGVVGFAHVEHSGGFTPRCCSMGLVQRTVLSVVVSGSPRSRTPGASALLGGGCRLYLCRRTWSRASSRQTCRTPMLSTISRPSAVTQSQ